MFTIFGLTARGAYCSSSHHVDVDASLLPVGRQMEGATDGLEPSGSASSQDVGAAIALVRDELVSRPSDLRGMATRTELAASRIMSREADETAARQQELAANTQRRAIEHLEAAYAIAVAPRGPQCLVESDLSQLREYQGQLCATWQKPEELTWLLLNPPVSSRAQRPLVPDHMRALLLEWVSAGVPEDVARAAIGTLVWKADTSEFAQRIYTWVMVPRAIPSDTETAQAVRCESKEWWEELPRKLRAGVPESALIELVSSASQTHTQTDHVMLSPSRSYGSFNSAPSRKGRTVTQVDLREFFVWQDASRSAHEPVNASRPRSPCRSVHERHVRFEDGSLSSSRGNGMPIDAEMTRSRHDLLSVSPTGNQPVEVRRASSVVVQQDPRHTRRVLVTEVD